MLPIEVEIQSLRFIAKSEFTNDQCYQARYKELAFLDEQMLTTLHDIQGY